MSGINVCLGSYLINSGTLPLLQAIKNRMGGRPGNKVRVSDQYLDATNNRTLVYGEKSHADNWLYHGNKGCVLCAQGPALHEASFSVCSITAYIFGC